MTTSIARVSRWAASASPSSDGALLYYFIYLVKYGESVYASPMLSSDDGLNQQNGLLEFQQAIAIDHLPPDFRLRIEVYALVSGAHI